MYDESVCFLTGGTLFAFVLHFREWLQRVSILASTLCKEIVIMVNFSAEHVLFLWNYFFSFFFFSVSFFANWKGRWDSITVLVYSTGPYLSLLNIDSYSIACIGHRWSERFECESWMAYRFVTLNIQMGYRHSRENWWACYIIRVGIFVLKNFKFLIMKKKVASAPDKHTESK